MPEENNAAAKPETGAEAAPSVVKDANSATIVNQAADADKQAQEAENQRLIDADPATLSEEEQGKRDVLVKAQEDAKLLETPDDQLDDAQKAKKAELQKAKEAEGKDKPEKKAPEKYEFKAPEGMELDQALVDKISPIFKGLNLTQEDANKIVNAYAEQIKSAADAEAESLKKFQQDSYDETIKALGADSKEKLSLVAKVRDMFFSAESMELLDASGLSNQKSFVLDLIKIGKQISETRIPAGPSSASTKEKSAAETLYGSQGKE